MDEPQLRNIVAFCAIMQGDGGIATKSPEYIEEKFRRYLGEPYMVKQTPEYGWGVHPLLYKEVVEAWIEEWE